MTAARKTMRELSPDLIEEWSRDAARDASPKGAAEAEIAYRAFMIMAFIYGDLHLPSRSLH